MTQYTLEDGRPLSLGNTGQRGRSGTVYPAHVPGRAGQRLAVKLPDVVDERYERRLRRLLATRGDIRARRHPLPVAVPLTAVLDGERLAGHAMVFVGANGGLTLAEVLDSRAASTRRTWADHLMIAVALARAVDAVHRAGYVLADLSERNIMVLPDLLAVLLDLDDAQLPGDEPWTHSDRHTPGLLPAELLDVDLTTTRRRQSADLHALGVLIWRLLLPESDPYDGWPTEMPVTRVLYRSSEANLREGRTRVAPGHDLELPAHAPDVDVLPLRLVRLLEACFVDARRRPEDRPAAAVWDAELSLVTNGLRRCERRHRHVHALRACPWCAAVADPWSAS